MDPPTYSKPSATPPTAVGGVPLPAGGDRDEVAGARNRRFGAPSTADESGRATYLFPPWPYSSEWGRFARHERRTSMRLPALLILAFVASGCTIHVVEQPATPVLVAEAPRPAPPRYAPRPHATYEYEVAAVPAAPAAPSARPEPPAPPRAHAPTVSKPARPPRAHAPTVSKPAKPYRIPFRTLPPEARTTHLARAATPKRKPGPQRLKRPELLAGGSSTSVAQAK